MTAQEPVEAINRRALERLALVLLSRDDLEWDFRPGEAVLRMPPRLRIVRQTIVDETVRIVVILGPDRLIVERAGSSHVLTCEESNTVAQLARVLADRSRGYVEDVVTGIINDLDRAVTHGLDTPPPVDGMTNRYTDQMMDGSTRYVTPPTSLIEIRERPSPAALLFVQLIIVLAIVTTATYLVGTALGWW